MRARKRILTAVLIMTMLLCFVGEVSAQDEYIIYGPAAIKTRSSDQYGIPNATISYLPTYTNIYLRVNTESQYYYQVGASFNCPTVGTSKALIKNSGETNLYTQLDIRNVFSGYSLPSFAPDSHALTLSLVRATKTGLNNGWEFVNNDWIPDEWLIPGDVKLYTDAYIPIGINFPTIGINSVKINWNNQANPADTSYTLQRSLDQENWTNVTTQPGIYEYTDTGLSQNSKYYYRIRVNEKRGTYKYSSVAWVETSTDPAVAAAKAAQSAAESTKGFTEEAKLAAQNAETKTNQLYDYVTGLELDSMNSKIEKLSNRVTGFIKQVYIESGATATTSSSSPPIFISASGLTHFELSIDGVNWVGPYEVGSSATIILQNGLNTVKVRAYHGDIPDTYAYDQKVVFKL